MAGKVISLADYVASRERRQQNEERLLAQDRAGHPRQQASKSTAVIIPFPRPGPRRPAA